MGKCFFIQKENDDFMRELDVEKFDPETMYAFYQEENGFKIFLDPLHYRHLLDDYGSEDYLPGELKGIINSSKKFILTQKVQKRYKFLNHIPQYAQCQFIDIQMKSKLRPKYFKKFIQDYNRKQKHLKIKKLKEQKYLE